MSICGACGTDNRGGARFCNGCGSPLERACPACGAAASPDARFCDSCGVPLEGAPPAAAPSAAHDIAAAHAERRLVSVLFADLVGFTALSDGRDPEDVRALLDRYFTRASDAVARHGGTVEKFIGDAVMAVWGTPVAREDDAERAVRTALALVDEVRQLGDDIGAPLAARCGVLTGEVAARLGTSDGQGMVVGETVNAASRLQSLAEPGSVFVDDATRRAASGAILFAPEGVHELRGVSEPVTVHRALRVVGGAGGALRRDEIEPPFVGRDAEWRTLLGAFETVMDGGPLQLVTVLGVAGVGKSRLGWELEKHADGIAADVLWHRGRAPAYGDGLAYFALADIVRRRCAINQDDPQEEALAKLAATVAEYVPIEAERTVVERRLAALLGLTDAGGIGMQADLFAGWRLFIERLADRDPVALVFEDFQNADAGTLDFLAHLREWSATRPILIVVLARPELRDRRPELAEGAIVLDPIGGAMPELLEGIVPGLAPDAVARIADGAEGIPLYAVETVRMLLDRGVLERDGDVCKVVGDLDAAAMPETMQALIAARLDALAPDDRALVLTAAVLGQQVTVESLAGVAGGPPAAVEQALQRLVAAQIFGREEDERSPDFGQFRFLQSTIRRVAYGMLSREDRRTRHLGSADFFGRIGGRSIAVAEIVADHLVAAMELAPDAPDAAALADRARAALTAAGDQALALASAEPARHAYLRAIDLSSDPGERGDLLVRAGEATLLLSQPEEGIALLRRAQEDLRAAGRPRDAHLVLISLSQAYRMLQIDSALVPEMEAACEELAEVRDRTLGMVSARLAHARAIGGDLGADVALDRAGEIAQELGDDELLARVFAARILDLMNRGRFREVEALAPYALEVAREHCDDLRIEASISNNYASTLVEGERYERAVEVMAEEREHLERHGMRIFTFPMNMAACLRELGRWDEALALLEETVAELPPAGLIQYHQIGSAIRVARGAGLDEVAGRLETLELGDEEDDVEAAMAAIDSRVILAAAGRDPEAAAAALREGLDILTGNWFSADIRPAVALALEVVRATAPGHRAIADCAARLRALPEGRRRTWMTALLELLDAAAADDADEAVRLASAATERLAAIGMAVAAAKARAELAGHLAAAGRADEAAEAAARAQAVLDGVGAVWAPPPVAQPVAAPAP